MMRDWIRLKVGYWLVPLAAILPALVVVLALSASARNAHALSQRSGHPGFAFSPTRSPTRCPSACPPTVTPTVTATPAAPLPPTCPHATCRFQFSITKQVHIPSSVAVDGAGRIYVVGSSGLSAFDSAGAYLAPFSAAMDTRGTLGSAYGVALGKDGIIYVAAGSAYHSRVASIRKDGAPSGLGAILTRNGGFVAAVDIALDSRAIYVVDWARSQVDVFDPSSGILLHQISSLHSPSGIAVDAHRRVYVADSGNNRIAVFNSSVAYLSQIGGDGLLSNPSGVAVDGSGRVYVADSGHNRVLIFNSSGKLLYQLGGPGSGSGQFSDPLAVRVDGAGRIYVVDAGHNRVEVFGLAP